MKSKIMWKELAVVLVVMSLITLFINSKTREKYSHFYTLYRNAPSSPSLRVYVATFDSKGTDKGWNEYHTNINKLNCERTADLFQSHPDGKDVKYWCERGRPKK